MNTLSSPRRWPLIVTLVCAVAPAPAQPPLDEGQARYMGAYVVSRQFEVFRRYCGGDDGARHALETGITAFRAANPDFAAALQARPDDAALRAGVAAFDARFGELADAMHAYLATQPAAVRCASIARHVATMRFAAMIDDATAGARDAVTAGEP